jgi:hypothetical protein
MFRTVGPWTVFLTPEADGWRFGGTRGDILRGFDVWIEDGDNARAQFEAFSGDRSAVDAVIDADVAEREIDAFAERLRRLPRAERSGPDW